MNRAAKRFGYVPGVVASANSGRDSSHGKAIVTPAPARTLRREMPWADFFVGLGILVSFLFRGLFQAIGASFVHELRAGDDGLDQRREAITIGGRHASHPLHGGVVGEQKRTAKRV